MKTSAGNTNSNTESLPEDETSPEKKANKNKQVQQPKKIVPVAPVDPNTYIRVIP